MSYPLASAKRKRDVHEDLGRAMCRHRCRQKICLVCILIGGPGEKVQTDVRKYGTTTTELESLKGWLIKSGCTQVVMESTGSYWKPVLNVLEAEIAIVLANARHVKNVPGRKSDVIDCQWLAQLLRYGLIRGSFIPPRDIRNLRDLTRRRRQLIGATTSEKNRIQKVLEDANLKLSVPFSVMSLGRLAEPCFGL
jgi:transposase